MFSPRGVFSFRLNGIYTKFRKTFPCFVLPISFAEAFLTETPWKFIRYHFSPIYSLSYFFYLFLSLYLSILYGTNALSAFRGYCGVRVSLNLKNYALHLIDRSVVLERFSSRQTEWRTELTRRWRYSFFRCVFFFDTQRAKENAF